MVHSLSYPRDRRRAVAISLIGLLAIGLSACGPGSGSVTPNTTSQVTGKGGTNSMAGASNTVAVAGLRKSFFDPLPTGARDPFFPHRRKLASVPDSEAAIPVRDVTSDLIVKTILPGRIPRAWINYRSFITGEKASLKLDTGARLSIRCIEIREKSVLVEIEGVPGRKELPLRGSR